MKFNPDIPDINDPNYLGYSKSIEQPKADTTYGELFKGIGDSLKASVTAGDLIVKENIEDSLRKEIQPLQEGFITKLENTNAKQQGKYDIITADDSGKIAPPEVQAFGDRLDSLQESYISGKYKPDEYRAELYRVLKKVRYNNPGYVDYVDKKASEITGFNIANAYASTLLSKLNETANSAQQEYNKTLQYIKENIGIVGYDMVDAFEKGQVDRVTVLKTIAQRKGEYEQMKYDAEKLKAKQGKFEDNKIDAVDTINRRVPQIVNNAYSDVLTASGYNGKNVQDMIQDHMSGKKPLDPTTIVALGQRFSALRPQLYQKAYDEFVTHGQVAALGSEEVNKRINAGLEGFDQVSRLISKEAFTAANYTADYAKAITEKDSLGVLLHPDMGPVVREHKALDKILGTNLYEKFINERLRSDPLLPGKIQKFQVDTAVGAIVQPKFETEGKPNTMKEDLEKPAKAGIKKDGPGAALEGKTVTGIVNNLDMVKDTRLPEEARVNVAKHWAFDPSNFGVLDKFEMESLNPKTGRMKDGALKVWDKATNKEFAQSVFAMSKKDPDVGVRYLDWIQDGFGNSIFRRSINDLKDIQLEPGMTLTWNDKTLQLKLDKGEGTVGPFRSKTGGLTAGFAKTVNTGNNVGTGQWDRAQQTIDNLNRGLRGLKNVIDATGKDVDGNAYVLSLLMDQKFDPSKNIKGLPEALMRAIKTTGNPPEEPKKVKEDNPGGGGGEPMPQQFAGLIEPGNIDLNNRSSLKDEGNGTHKTIRSISVESDGKHIVIPTVVDGKVVSNRQAILNYMNTGEHLGIFKTEQDAKTFAEKLHESEAVRTVKDNTDGTPHQWVLDRKTGKYVPYEPGPTVKGKNQDRVGK